MVYFFRPEVMGMLFLKILIVALLVGVILFVSSAFSQSTPPLDKPIERIPADQLSESGRIQQKNDERRSKINSPDSDENSISLCQNQLGKDSGIDEKNIPSRKVTNQPLN